MENQVIRINSQTWRIEEEGVRFFLLTGTKRALLVDSGMKTRNAKEIAQSLTDLPVELINTHSDIDHLGGNDSFPFAYMNPADYAQFHKAQGRTQKLLPVWDNDEIDLGDRVITVITLPGHTAGSIALLDKKYRALISGDPIQDGKIFMFGEYRDMHAYINSLEKLERYKDMFDEIYPSHGSFPLKPDIIKSLLKGAKDIIEGNIAYKAVEFMGKNIRVYNVGAASFLCDPQNRTDK